MKYLGNNIMQITQAELDTLAPWYEHDRSRVGEGDHYSSISWADHTPMVVEVYEHPLDGLRTRFYRVKIQAEARSER